MTRSPQPNPLLNAIRNATLILLDRTWVEVLAAGLLLFFPKRREGVVEEVMHAILITGILYAVLQQVSTGITETVAGVGGSVATSVEDPFDSVEYATDGFLRSGKYYG